MTEARSRAALYGVVGDPIAHSLSPLIHNHWMREAGINGQYRAIQVSDGTFTDGLATLTRQEAMGLNVTLPHKQAALEAAEGASALASRIGAANTLSRRPILGWYADNTDAPGFLDSLAVEFGAIDPTTDVLLLGAGGSARAVAVALADAGVNLRIANRTPGRAGDLMGSLGLPGSPLDLSAGLYQAAEFDLVINTTSAGHAGEPFDWPMVSDQFLMDISYGRAAAGNLAVAGERGWSVCDGLPMLVAQAARSFEIWFGFRPETDHILTRCRDLVEATNA